MARAPLFTWLKNKFYTKTEIDSKMDGKAPNTVVSSTSNGLMIATDKEKLDTVEVGANKTVVDGSMSATSSNPVQNKTVKAELDSLNSAIQNKVTQNYKKVSPITGVEYVLKNGFCTLIWLDLFANEDPTTYNSWITLCTVPKPQNNVIYPNVLTNTDSLMYRVTSTGEFQYRARSGQEYYNCQGHVTYPTLETG